MNGHVVPIPPGRFGDANQPFVNLDGYATLAPLIDGKVHAYAHLFRSGALEGATTVGEDPTGRCYIAAPTFESNIVAVLRNYLMFYKAIDVGLPLYIFLSFCGMSRCYFRMRTEYSGSGFYDRGPLQVDTVLLPEATIDSDPADISATMRPSFNTFWNAFGHGLRSWPMIGSQNPASVIPGRASALPSTTQGGSRMRESRTYGCVSSEGWHVQQGTNLPG